MNPVQKHLRNTFLAGIFAAIPVGITLFIVWYVEHVTREPLKQLFGLNIPFIGIPVALGLIYFLGLAVTSLIGRFVLRSVDKLLSRVPVLKELYRAWKQVTLTPGGGEGMYSKVVIVPTDGTNAGMIGFTNGEPLVGDPDTCCVFVPNVPNPVTGRLLLVRRDKCRPLDISAEDAFKMILSSGNYVPEQIGAAMSMKSQIELESE